MARKKAPTPTTAPNPKRWALYARTSSDEQAEADTIAIQVDFLRQFATLHGLEIAGEYLDDGVSGTLPMDERPAGSDLLRDARDGRFAGVLFYRVNRLGRRLYVVMEAHKALTAAGVALRSGTEPIDTENPIGRFVFQLLASFAELDRETILDNTAAGKLKNARNGHWYGTCPLGYTVRDHRLVPCEDEAAPGLRECDLVRDVIVKIAEGSSVIREARRLTALGIVPFVRHAKHDGTVYLRTEFKPKRGGEKRQAAEWSVQRISRLVRSPIYKGEHTFSSRRQGTTTVAVPALVDAATWDRANAQVEQNRWLQVSGTREHYALTGKVVCGNCGTRYHGHRVRRYWGEERTGRYYRCPGYTETVVDGKAVRTRCVGKAVPADALEEFVWKWAKEILTTAPDEVVSEVRDRVFERDLQDDTARRRGLIARVAELDGDRKRVLDMAQRGMMDMNEAQERTMALIQQRAAVLAELDALANAQELAQAYEHQLEEVRAMIAQGLAYLDVEDPEIREMRLRQILSAVVIKTERQSQRQAEATITAVFGPKARPIGVVKRRDREVMLELSADGCAVERQSSR